MAMIRVNIVPIKQRQGLQDWTPIRTCVQDLHTAIHTYDCIKEGVNQKAFLFFSSSKLQIDRAYSDASFRSCAITETLYGYSTEKNMQPRMKHGSLS